jgi:photosystem II stability/assembly factor-like uncharacterized protein
MVVKMNRKNLQSILVDRKKNFVITFFLLVVSFTNLNAGSWEQQLSGINSDFHSVYFIDENTGWSVGDGGIILKTMDGGENWELQTSGTEEDLYCVFFVDSAIGWVAGTHGAILKSTDGGINWTSQNSGTIYIQFSIFFVDQSTGWACGNGGTLLNTTDGGENWEPQNISFDGTISCLDFVDSLYGWAATSQSGAPETTILKTTNGGNNWELITIPMLIPLPVFSVDFIDRNTGWVVGLYEIIYKSTDGGNNWFEQLFGLSSTPEGFLSVSFADNDNGWSVGYEGIIAFTSDGGNLWSSQASGTTVNLWDVYFVNDSLGWAVGENGTILRYGTPSPVSVEGNQSNPGQDKFILCHNYPNPFNPTTTIKYTIPNVGTSFMKFLKLKVYNTLGEEVATLVNEEKPAGIYSVKFDGGNLPSGVYIYRLTAGSYSSAKKLILLK